MDNTRRRILIVDDSAANIGTLGLALSGEYDVLVALTGAEALKLAVEQHPNLILLDVAMPNMDGHEVCRALKTNPATKSIPVIFVTALDEEADEAAGLALGAVDYLTKPIRPAIVRARVHLHLEREQLIIDLQKALTEINTLTSLIPMCAWCRRLRSDEGYWLQVEFYLANHSRSTVSHGICPDCAALLQDESSK